MSVETKFSIEIKTQIEEMMNCLIAAFGGRSQVWWPAVGAALAGQTNQRGLLHEHASVRQCWRKERLGNFLVISKQTIREISLIAINALWDDLSPEEEAVSVEKVMEGFISSDFFIIE